MKKAIIIGATSGIGKGLAKILAEHNYVVGIAGRRTKLLEECRYEKPNSFVIKTLDIMDINTIIQKLEALKKEIGGLDLLILSSGMGDLNHTLDFKIEKQTIDTNILGFTCIATWAFNQFKKQKFGHFVAVTSVGGLRGSRQAPAYNATKSYQINYLEALRQKANKLENTMFITDIRPGFVDTDLAKGEGLFWVASVDKATRQIVKALIKKKKVVYITRRWRIIAILLKHMPRLLYEKL